MSTYGERLAIRREIFGDGRNKHAREAGKPSEPCHSYFTVARKNKCNVPYFAADTLVIMTTLTTSIINDRRASSITYVPSSRVPREYREKAVAHLSMTSYLKKEDNDPSLLSFFSNREKLRTYGLQSIHERKELCAAIRDNARAFNELGDLILPLSDNGQYSEKEIQQYLTKSQFNQIKHRLNERLCQEFLNPKSLQEVISKDDSGKNITKADHYKKTLRNFFELIQFNCEASPREIIINGKLNPDIGAKIKIFIYNILLECILQ